MYYNRIPILTASMCMHVTFAELPQIRYNPIKLANLYHIIKVYKKWDHICQLLNPVIT